MHGSIRISAADGYALGGTVFDGGRGPVVVLSGATGVHQRYYARFAGWLASEGATVVTFDYRGIGESRPHRLRGFEARARDWGELDLEGVLGFASETFPRRPLQVIGHSVGGQLVGLAPSMERASAVMTVASQSGYWGHWPLPSKVAFAGLWYGLMPLTSSLFGYFPGRLGIGEDLPRGVAQEWARWCRSAGYFIDHGVSPAGFAKVRAPVLAFSFTDDAYAPKPAVDWLHGLFTSASVERRHLSPGDLEVRAVGHFGFFRDAYRDSLWAAARDFLLGKRQVRSAPRPALEAEFLGCV
ncbi:MAG: alpha/beta fold hydrolase [Myxococcota bacterium]